MGNCICPFNQWYFIIIPTVFLTFLCIYISFQMLNFLDAIASPSTFPCMHFSAWFLCISLLRFYVFLCFVSMYFSALFLCISLLRFDDFLCFVSMFFSASFRCFSLLRFYAMHFSAWFLSISLLALVALVAEV